MDRKRKPSLPFTRVAAYALAGVCIVIIGLIVLIPGPAEHAPPNLPPAQQPAGQPPQGQGQDTSAVYRPLPSLEGLIASARKQVEFRALSPAETVPKGTLVVFRWEDNEKGPWKVTVLDNRGATVREEEVKEPDYTLSSPRPGLYYWTVAREDRLLHVGRVAVR